MIHDDILIFREGATEEEAIKDHDDNLHAVMQRCQERNVKLNKVKLPRKEVAFMCHLISEKGLKPEPGKVKAVLDTCMPTPTDVTSVRRFIGFTNYLKKFLPRLCDVSHFETSLSKIPSGSGQISMIGRLTK